MASYRSPAQLTLARVWSYPLWFVAMRSKSRDVILTDVDWWVECLKDENLAALDTYTQFAFFTGALKEFRSLVHYRLRTGTSFPLRMLMRRIYKGQDGLLLEPRALGPACFISHGVATLIDAVSIGSHFHLHQQVTIGFTDEGKPPRIGDHVTIGAGALVLGDITIGDGAFIGAGAIVLDDVAPGEVMVSPKARVLKRLSAGGAAPTAVPSAEPESPAR
jgi:serine O-acetyltransferase